MPKAKPTQVIVHRMDMQPSVKDSLDAFLLGKTATNAVSAVGSVLAPFGGAITAFAAAWIAKEGWEAVYDWFDKTMQGKGDDWVEDRYGEERRKYMLVGATIKSCTNFGQFAPGAQNLIDELSGGPEFVKTAWMRWLRTNSHLSWMKYDATWPDEVFDSWTEFYPPQQLLQDVETDMRKKFKWQNLIPRGSPFKWML